MGGRKACKFCYSSFIFCHQVAIIFLHFNQRIVNILENVPQKITSSHLPYFSDIDTWYIYIYVFTNIFLIFILYPSYSTITTFWGLFLRLYFEVYSEFLRLFHGYFNYFEGYCKVIFKVILNAIPGDSASMLAPSCYICFADLSKIIKTTFFFFANQC